VFPRKILRDRYLPTYLNISAEEKPLSAVKS